MPNILQYAGQGLFYTAVAAIAGYFAANPVWREVPEGEAQIKLAVSHGGRPVQDCHRLTPEELAKLPSNARRPSNCTRERLPVKIRLTIDGQVLYEDVLPPTGWSRDGVSRAYRKFLVPAGHHAIDLALTDSRRADGFDYTSHYVTDLKPWQNLAIDFKAEQGGFIFR
jgi:hypothetical protein